MKPRTTMTIMISMGIDNYVLTNAHPGMCFQGCWPNISRVA